MREFVATAAMRRYAQALCDPSIPEEESKRCEAAGVSIQRLRRWQKKAAFQRWLRGESERLLQGQSLLLWKAVLLKAHEGALPAAKLFLERFGQAPREEPQTDSGPQTFKDLVLMAARDAVEEPEIDEEEEDSSDATPLESGAERSGNDHSEPNGTGK